MMGVVRTEPNDHPLPLHLKRPACDESSLGLITKMDSVYENKKNKQLNAVEGKADFGRSSTCFCCQLLP